MNYKTNRFSSVKESFSIEKESLADERILCKQCMAYIANKDDIMAIEGSASHYKRNPAGIFFSIICLSSASGCTILGDYTSEHSWFLGYKWSIALCSSCVSHLGWHFIGKGSFYGLIANRIIGI